jgi:hypothetical protein
MKAKDLYLGFISLLKDPKAQLKFSQLPILGQLFPLIRSMVVSSLINNLLFKQVSLDFLLIRLLRYGLYLFFHSISS